jgi:hypothetical protein
MKMPTSLIDKRIRVLNGPIIPGRIDTDALEKVEIRYLDYELGCILSRYKDSHTVNHLVSIIKELQHDIVTLRSHVTWMENKNEEAL